MAGIFDYIEWRGDLDFHQAPFNPVDNIILTHISYFPFDHIVGGAEEKEDMTITEAAKKIARILKKNPAAFDDGLVYRDDPALMEALGSSRRYGDLKLRGYVNQIDPAAEKQFSALCILGCGGMSLISYRGTDNTIVGWKEDFNMSFSDVIPAQLEAVSYLEKMAAKIQGPLCLGGHSKGGNLAIYAAAFCKKNIRRRIKYIYSNDAPGFNRAVLESPGFLEIKNRIQAFVPQSSIVGMLFEHPEHYAVVKSSQTGLMQHDVFSWEVKRDDVVRMKEINPETAFVNRILQEWIDGLDAEKRRRFVDALYEILASAEANSLPELGNDWPKSVSLMVRTYSGIDGETKKLITKTIAAFFKAARKNISLLIPAGEAFKKTKRRPNRP
ncbi:MAG: DUF2974 domain-containing protein [Treponema sp.]|jgi:hypothetical protein|nr:DUF2974 domain-containing protein [Treponema sp.]